MVYKDYLKVIILKISKKNIRYIFAIHNGSSVLCVWLSGPSYHSLPWVCRGVVLSFPHSYELADQNCNDHLGSRQIEPPCYHHIFFNPILQSLWFKCYAFVVFCVARITTFLGKWWLIKEVCNFRESTQKLFIEVIIIFSIIVLNHHYHFNV